MQSQRHQQMGSKNQDLVNLSSQTGQSLISEQRDISDKKTAPTMIRMIIVEIELSVVIIF
jgi:hypothetical protein